MNKKENFGEEGTSKNGGNGEDRNKEPKVAKYAGTVMESGDTKWRIVVGTLVLRPGDEVSWKADKSDMLFGFPVNMNDYFELNEGQFTKTKESPKWPEIESNTPSDVRKVQPLAAGDSLTLKVKEDAEEARIDYDIYVEEAEEFVVGNSPTLIIQKPYRT